MPKRTAKSYIENYWDYQLPVQPEKIAEAEGLRVLDIQLLGCENLSGAFKPDYEGMPTIFVNRTEGHTRQRFTVAHELGHYALENIKSVETLSEMFEVSENAMRFRLKNLGWLK
ncbi:MAG: ImmA/IrrE family metallo-endopeptidase [Moraxella osloensis]|nr:ImmA/IrrE family metallo-endopeptidase [Moraxella osloensis]